MAKLALIFFVVFCIVQIALASRIVRDTDTKPAIDTSAFDDIYKKTKDVLGETFSEANIAKAKESATKFGDTLLDGMKNLGEKIKSTAQQATS